MKARSAWAKRILLLCIIMLFAAACMACSDRFVAMEFPMPLQSGDIPLYGDEGSDTSMLLITDFLGRYGFCDPSGKVVIKPQFSGARLFHEGLAVIREGFRYGYIDKNGRIVIPTEYYDALDFHNGRAIVANKSKNIMELAVVAQSCLIDKEGKLLSQDNFQGVGKFSEGMQWVYRDNKYFFLNTDTYTITPAPEHGDWFGSISLFREGLAPIPTNNSGVYYADKTGKDVGIGIFKWALHFSEGLAPAIPLDAEQEDRYGYIDKTGAFAIAPKFLLSSGFGEGLACAQRQDGVWVIIGTDGTEKCTIQPDIDIAKSFSEGLCAVGVANDKVKTAANDDQEYVWGFIDTKGKLVIDFKYNTVSPFLNGIAEIILLQDRIGYIDRTGKYIWEPK